jgi:hypothetical protein
MGAKRESEEERNVVMLYNDHYSEIFKERKIERKKE